MNEKFNDYWKLIDSDPKLRDFITNKLNEGLKIEETGKNLQKAEEDLKVAGESLVSITKERDEYKTKYENLQTELSAFKAKEASDKRQALIAEKLGELKFDQNVVYPDLMTMWGKMENEEKVIESIKQFTQYYNEKVKSVKSNIYVPPVSAPKVGEVKSTGYLSMDLGKFKQEVFKD